MDFGHDQSFNIRLKLLEGNNVIIAKCAGLPTEIFMPTIIDGRLSIINVVPQRRCPCISTNFIVAKRSKTKMLPRAGTPVRSLKDRPSLQTSTPDQLRCSKPLVEHTRSFRKSLQFGDVTCPDEISVINMRDNEHADSNLQHGRDSSQRDCSKSTDHNVRIPLGSLSNMDWPTTPNAPLPHIDSLIEQNRDNFPFHNSKAFNIPKWGKVLTPVRTYSQQKYTPSSIVEKTSLKCLVTATVGIKAERHVVALKHKLKKKNLTIDQKIRISPKTFKRQFQCEDATGLYNALCQEHKNRKFEATKKTSFELFTTPTRVVCPKLEKLFRGRCANKFSSTYPRYKELAKVESLKNPL